MKSSLQPGVTGSASFVVDRERTIDFMGEKARVYATPMLVRDVPKPVLKLLGDLSRMSSVLAAITTQSKDNGVQTVII